MAALENNTQHSNGILFVSYVYARCECMWVCMLVCVFGLVVSVSEETYNETNTTEMVTLSNETGLAELNVQNVCAKWQEARGYCAIGIEFGI